MPVADEGGGLSYDRTITVSQAFADHIKDLHIVQHSIDPHGNGEYDFGKGKSELDPRVRRRPGCWQVVARPSSAVPVCWSRLAAVPVPAQAPSTVDRVP
jgi:hypothetical protein